ncbi:helix-turn-helix domain-containing protein [Mammaliicoccus sciuri]|uniref:helix-turn-helix domain-containing protein n=1 Tax=Mammaliicoccus sciuri TaxID=1296 RepID=UPI0037C90B89
MIDASKSSSNEYGFVNKDIMKNPNISVEAKTIYAYLSSYAGNKDTAFPSVSLICYELNMSKNRYYKHRKELMNNEIIFNENIEN